MYGYSVYGIQPEIKQICYLICGYVHIACEPTARYTVNTVPWQVRTESLLPACYAKSCYDNYCRNACYAKSAYATIVCNSCYVKSAIYIY